jgi:molybdopterin converting factor small subunit
MMVRVEYTAHLKRAAGTASEEIEIGAAASLSELIETLTELHGENFRNQMLDSKGNLRPAAVIAVNGEQVYLESPRSLQEGDRVLFLAAIAGG